MSQRESCPRRSRRVAGIDAGPRSSTSATGRRGAGSRCSSSSNCAHALVRFGDAQRRCPVAHAARHVGEHPNRRQIDVRGERQVEDDAPHRRLRGDRASRSCDPHGVDVEVEQGRVRAEDEHARHGLRVGMARERREMVGCPESGRAARTRAAPAGGSASPARTRRRPARPSGCRGRARRRSSRSAITNSPLLTRRSWRSSSNLNMLCTDASTSAASSGCGRR